MRTMVISFHQTSNVGNRQVNEDCVSVIYQDDSTCFCLCDGLGGHGNGDEASSFICSFITERFMESKSDLNTVLKSLVNDAQEALVKRKSEDPQKSNMLTTLCLLIISHNQANYIHVGDSRIYHFRDGKLKIRTLDHSVPQMLVSTGELKEKDIRFHEDRNRLLRAMGTSWTKEMFNIPDETITLQPGDSFLLCSDGFWELINEDNMQKCLKKAKTSQEWIETMQAIVFKNGKNINMDNYSAIAIWIR